MDAPREDSSASESAAPAGTSWARTLFVWTCQNCTRTAPVVPPSSEMLTYATQFESRLAGWRQLQAAKRAALAELADFQARAAAAIVDVDGFSAQDRALPALPPPPPPLPDFKALEAALPPVPLPPPVPEKLMASQAS